MRTLGRVDEARSFHRYQLASVEAAGCHLADPSGALVPPGLAIAREYREDIATSTHGLSRCLRQLVLDADRIRAADADQERGLDVRGHRRREVQAPHLPH